MDMVTIPFLMARPRGEVMGRIAWYRCIAVWQRGRWHWRPVDGHTTRATPEEMERAGRARPPCRVAFDTIMTEDDKMFWDRLQGADHVP